ncbi:MAG: ABC transporter permease [Pseudomonadota bacterium]
MPADTQHRAQCRLRQNSRRFERSWATQRSISALILREMSVTYGRSPGGYLWAFLEPAAGILLLTFLFSKAFHAPPLGHSFALFYATGLIPFLAYSDIASKVSQSLNFSRQLLAYPAVTFIDALLARLSLNFLTQMLVGYGLFTGLWLSLETRPAFSPDDLVLAYAMLACFAAGIGTFNCVLISIFPMWQQIWSIINRPLLIISCVFFLYDDVPHPYSDWLWWNPLVHIVGQTRAAFYPAYDAAYISPTYVFGISLILFVLGLVFLSRYHREIVHG